MSDHEEEAYRQFEACLDRVLRFLGPLPFQPDRQQLFEENKSVFLDPGKEQREFVLSWLLALPVWMWLEILARIRYVAQPWAYREVDKRPPCVDPNG